MKVEYRGWYVIHFIREEDEAEWTIVRRPSSFSSEWRRRGQWINEGKAWIDEIEGPKKERVRPKPPPAAATPNVWMGIPDSVKAACSFFSIWEPPRTEKEVKARWRRIAKMHHPDIGGDGRVMVKANQMMDIILEWMNR